MRQAAGAKEETAAGSRKAAAEAQDKGLTKMSRLPESHGSGAKGPTSLAAPPLTCVQGKLATVDLELLPSTLFHGTQVWPKGLPVSFIGKIKCFSLILRSVPFIILKMN